MDHTGYFLPLQLQTKHLMCVKYILRKILKDLTAMRKLRENKLSPHMKTSKPSTLEGVETFTI